MLFVIFYLLSFFLFSVFCFLWRYRVQLEVICLCCLLSFFFFSFFLFSVFCEDIRCNLRLSVFVVCFLFSVFCKGRDWVQLEVNISLKTSVVSIKFKSHQYWGTWIQWSRFSWHTLKEFMKGSWSEKKKERNLIRN